MLFIALYYLIRSKIYLLGINQKRVFHMNTITINFYVIKINYDGKNQTQ